MTATLNTFRLVALLGGVLLGMTHASGYTQKNEPITREGLLRSLSRKALSSKELIEQIEERGVDFRLTPADEQDIRRAGKYLRGEGLDALIEAVREHYRPIIAVPPVGETELHGILIPANDPSPPNPCGVLPEAAVTMILGNMYAWTTHFPMTVLWAHGHELITIGKTDDGLSVSAKVFSADGRIVADLEDNEFHVNPNNYFKVKRPDRSTLIVYDQQDRSVLRVRYLNPKTIRFSGIFHYPPQFVPLVVDEEKVRLRSVEQAKAICAGNNRIAFFIGNPVDLMKAPESKP